MHHIEIETVWRFHKEGSPQTAVVMLGVLNEIRKTGKLTSAAKHAQLSYRHVWNLVEQWSEFFGVPLVETHRGKGTVLTAFGEKLVWAGERMQARLGPQLENLAQELATEIKPFLHQRPSVIRVHASHGFAVSKLRELLDREPGIGVDLRYVSNQNSLVSLAQGACDLSGVHLPRGELRAQGIRACKEWLDPREDRVISFVTREMGLMVKRGNPLEDRVDQGSRRSQGALRQPRPRFRHAAAVRPVAGAAQDRRGQNQRRAADGIHPRRGRRLCRQRHGGCEFRRRGRRPAVRARFHPVADGGLFLRLQARVSGNRADAARHRHHEGPRVPGEVASLPGYVATNTGTVSTVKEFLESVGSGAA